MWWYLIPFPVCTPPRKDLLFSLISTIISKTRILLLHLDFMICLSIKSAYHFLSELSLPGKSVWFISSLLPLSVVRQFRSRVLQLNTKRSWICSWIWLFSERWFINLCHAGLSGITRDVPREAAFSLLFFWDWID